MYSYDTHIPLLSCDSLAQALPCLELCFSVTKTIHRHCVNRHETCEDLIFTSHSQELLVLG